MNIRQPASWSPRRTLLARLRTSLATVASCVLAAGCYLSHERLDDSVPFSACVADDATVALACRESIDPAFCSDGIDNDLDGFTDCADADCAYNPLVTACAGLPRPCE